jgi:hypothetical protein
MRHLILFVASVMVGVTTITSSNLQGAPRADAQEASMSAMDGLQVKYRTNTSIAGVHRYTGSLITFTSKLNKASQVVTTKLVINGSVLTGVKNLETEDVSLQADGMILNELETAAFLDLVDELELVNVRYSEIRLQEDFLYRLTNYYAMAPVNYALPDQEVPKTRVSYENTVPTSEQTNAPTEKECERAEASGNFRTMASCLRSDEDGIA